MLYFFIVPIYLIVLFTLLVAALICRLRPHLRQLSGYFVASAIGSIPGFIVGNLILVAVVAPIITGEIILPESWYWLTATIAGLGLIVGPFVVSFSGSLLGALAGWSICRNRRLRRKGKFSPF